MYRWLKDRQPCAYIWEVFQRMGLEKANSIGNGPGK